MTDDATCLSRYARTSDAEAFAILVQRHAGLVFAAGLRVCGNRSDAEDAAQEAFLALARHAGRIRTSLPAWLHTVTTHAALQVRRRRRHQQFDGIPEPADTDCEGWREALDQVDEAVAELPEDLRMVVVLRHLRGRTQEEIAHELGLSQATVSRRLELAIGQLRRRLRWSTDGTDRAEQLALGVLMTASQMHAPASVLANLGRLAVLGPTPYHVGSVFGTLVGNAVLVLVLAGGIIVLLFVLLHDHQCATVPVAAPSIPAVAGHSTLPVAAPAAAADLPDTSVLDRHITITWHGGRLDRVVWALGTQLRSQDDEWIAILPDDHGAQAQVTVDLALADVPLRQVLEAIRAQTGYRWRESRGYVLLDHPMDESAHARLLAELNRPEAVGDHQGSASDAAWALATSGDAQAIAELLCSLGDARLTGNGSSPQKGDGTAPERPAPDVAAYDAAVLRALGSLGMDLEPWDLGSRVLLGLRDAPGVRMALARAWGQRLRQSLPPTPLWCALMGIFGVQEARPDLMALIGDTQAEAELRAGRRAHAAALQRTRQAAYVALGELGATEAAGPMRAWLRRDPGDPSSMARIEALGRLHDHDSLEILTAGTPSWSSWVPWSYQYCAVESIDPVSLMRLLPPNHPLSAWANADDAVPSGWWYGFITYPCLEVLPRLLNVPHPEARSWWCQSALRVGTPRLPRAEALTALRQRLSIEQDPKTRAFLRCMGARLGDRAALLDGIAEAISNQGRSPWQNLALVAPTLDPDTATQAFAPMLTALDPDHPNACFLLCLEPAYGPHLRELLGSRTYAAGDVGVVMRFLANDPSSVRTRCLPLLQGSEAASRLLDLPDSWDHDLAVLAAHLVLTGNPETTAPLLGRLIADPWSADLLPGVISHVGGLPLARVTPGLIQALDATTDNLPLQGQAREGLARIVMHWLSAASDPRVRAAAATWMGHHLVVDFRVPCAQALTLLAQCCESDRDAGVQAAVRAAIASHIDEGPFRGDNEGVAQIRMLAGSFDDPDEIARIDDLLPRLQKDLLTTFPTTALTPMAPRRNGAF